MGEDLGNKMGSTRNSAHTDNSGRQNTMHVYAESLSEDVHGSKHVQAGIG